METLVYLWISDGDGETTKICAGIHCARRSHETEHVEKEVENGQAGSNSHHFKSR
jgi:hypothetical protein